MIPVLLLCGPPLSGKSGRQCVRGRGGTRPSSNGTRIKVTSRIFSLVGKKSRISKVFFYIISKLIGHFSSALRGPVGGGVPELVPWASCLGKFVFWSCRRLKVYIRVFDISFVMSLCCRVCVGANSGCSFFFWCVRRTASCVMEKEGLQLAK
jgi:hypothetical protein